MITDVFRQKLEKLSARLDGEASYEQHDLCGLVPTGVDLDNRDWSSLEEAWQEVSSSVPYLVMRAQLNKDLGGGVFEECVSKHVSEQSDFHSFSFLAQGTSTVVMLAKSDNDLAVMRFSPHPSTSNGKLMKDDCNRCHFPGLLQPIRDNLIIGNNIMQAEIMPLVQTHPLDSEDKLVYNEYMDMLLEGTVYRMNGAETAILPDSTLVLFDPGEVPYTNEYWESEDYNKFLDEEASKSLVMMRINSWGIPENLIPVDQSYDLKQDISLDRTYVNNSDLYESYYSMQHEI